ncbi:HAD family hydrolase [Cyanobacterium aponinum UTEX 3222]|uniref:HAD family hydrolase n=2 Tax=Cyanobacterium TaxID=102234 RepID=A0AAF0ZEE2_9CHRO|nr:HAD family hydrolase [Cyanobacterium aponinum]WPF89444.1 HAD family hydrolase [Cyanobacterium aponinum AL20115]WRL41206.1 HAD family hydrolase [Cyanobacterium aponinum UTEX 3222]
MSLKGIIFDVDGTIAETERDGHRIAFNRAFERENLSWHWDVDLYGELLEIGGGKERIRYYISNYLPSFNINQSLDEFIAHLHLLKSRYYRQLLENNSIPLRLGVKRLIQEAYSQGVKVAIASTASVANVEALLETSLGNPMASWFEVIAAGDMVERKKPAPDIYLLALEKLNLSPHECIAIEDTNQGLTAAVKAGLKTVVTVNQYTEKQNFDEAILVLNHLGEKDLPFRVIQGENYGEKYFNLSLAEKLIS